MHTAWETFRNAGFIAWPILFFGFLGGAAAITAIVLAIMRARAAFWIGAIALLLGSLSAGLGGFGVLRGRAQTDGALLIVAPSPSVRARIQRAGYLEAQGAAKVGLFFAAFPLLAGAIAALTAKRGKPEQLGAIGLTAFGLLSATLAVLAMRAPIPGPEAETVAALAELHALVAAVTDAGSERDVLAECDALEGTLDDDRHDASREPALPAAAKRCTMARIVAAKAGGDEGMAAVRGRIERRFFAQSYPELRQMIREQLTPPPPPEAHTQTGSLPRKDIQRTVRRHMPKVRYCYDNGAAKEGLAGTVKVRFVIGAGGKVTSVSTDGSTLADPPTVKCIARVFEAMTFPRSEGGPVTVTYPIKLVVDDSAAPARR